VCEACKCKEPDADKGTERTYTVISQGCNSARELIWDVGTVLTRLAVRPAIRVYVKIILP
jgi:hypothetical protein